MSDGIDLGIDGLSDYTEIGSGGFATVFSAWEEGAGRQVAVKVLGMVDDAGRRRFDRERRTLGRTTEHPGIVTMFRSGYTSPDDRPYLVMEHLSGGSLQDQLDASGPLQVNEAIDITMTVADALDFGHEMGIVHRDVKPANVLVSGRGLVKLADFGIAAVSEATATSHVAYSIAYTPPESFDVTRDPRSDRLVDPRDERSDMYSLGLTLFTLVTGLAPFQGATPVALMRQIVDDPLPLTGVPGLDAVLAKATAKRPAERFQSAAMMAAALQALRSDLVQQGQQSYATVAADIATKSAAEVDAFAVDRVRRAQIQLRQALIHDYEAEAASRPSNRRSFVARLLHRGQ